jgi:hypothetical protein
LGVPVEHGSALPLLDAVRLAAVHLIQPDDEAARAKPTEGAKDAVLLPAGGFREFVGCGARRSTKPIDNPPELATGAHIFKGVEPP